MNVTALLNAMPVAVSQGLIWGTMAIGVLITYKILDVADLTVDGTMCTGGIDVTHLPEHKRAKYVGRVFRDPMMGTAATMQIGENLALAARRGKHRTLRAGITKAEREQFREMPIILDLGLEDRLTSKVGLLSGC